MPMYETTFRTPQGEEKKLIYAGTPQEAKKLFEQMKRMYSHDENLNESSCIDLVTTRKQQRQHKHLFEDQPLTS